MNVSHILFMEFCTCMCRQVFINLHEYVSSMSRKNWSILYKLDKNKHVFLSVYYFQVESTLLENNYALLKIDSLYKYFPPFFQGRRFIADLLPDGKIQMPGTKETFTSPSAWAIHCKKQVNPNKKSGCGWASVSCKKFLVPEISLIDIFAKQTLKFLKLYIAWKIWRMHYYFL